MSEFRDFLAGWLLERGWSANRLADETGIAQTLLSRYLHPDPQRRIRPTDQTLRKLSPVVGRSHDELMRMAGRLDASSEPAPLVDDDAEMLALFKRVPAEEKSTLKSIVQKYAVPPITKPYRRRITDLDTSLGRDNDELRLQATPVRPSDIRRSLSRSLVSQRREFGFQPA